VELLAPLAEQGFQVQADNEGAVDAAGTVILAVQPQQLDKVLPQIVPRLKPRRHLLISVVSGVQVAELHERIGAAVPVVRAMPNTAIEIGESMTCLAAAPAHAAALAYAEELFGLVGRTLVINENLMTGATALGGCGIAFFLRSIRAASQGGIEIGFHPKEALLMAAQTARGASALALRDRSHPESEIDKVTTPRGATIAGLNQMEHEGFSSALIKGIVTSAEKVARLYHG
jgi:pyrroline-5-carboxylate reductase